MPPAPRARQRHRRPVRVPRATARVTRARPGGARTGDGVTAALHHELHRRRRDNRQTAMSQLNPAINHLLRRAGFGASPADVDTFRDMSPWRRSRTSWITPGVRRRGRAHRRAGPRAGDDERFVRARHRHRRRAAALDVPDVPLAAPAAGKRGDVLAQPLRDGFHKLGRRLRTRQAANLCGAGRDGLRGPRGVQLFRETLLSAATAICC